MTPRERLLKVLRGEIPDCVPVAPDFSNMIPCKLTNMPFWDIYLHERMPLHEAYIRCARYFNIDSVMDGYFDLQFPEELAAFPDWKQAIVKKTDDMLVTQNYYFENSKRIWHDRVTVYYPKNPPAGQIKPEMIGLAPIPTKFEDFEPENKSDKSPEGFKKAKELLGEQGLIGVWAIYSSVLNNEEQIFDYYDNPEKYEKIAIQRIANAEKRFERIMQMDVKPDFICVGGSGTLVFQSVEIFRELALPAVKRICVLAKEAGIFTQMHSCGPEKELVRIMAEETDLSIIDPLEIPPMGDCDLKELKKRYGGKLVLKGNLHTTDVMLNGSVQDVIDASKKAIDDAAEGGGFILSTGDQCGRDTPFENLLAMIETARTYGKY